ncbi:MAG: enolase C-terminal domain-like protein, partial [Kofleriaceae bacterium]
ALCQAHGVPLSAHCAPAVSVHACCGVQRLAHLEYFHDHVRIEQMLFDGFIAARNGALQLDPMRAGIGVELKAPDAKRYAI